MMLIYWCSACRTLHPTDAVVIAWRTDGPAAPLCPRCGGALEPRGLPDDPDDPLYGAPRCPLCRAELRAEARFCARCGAPAPSAHDSPTGPLAEPLPTPPPSITADLLVGQARMRQRQRQIARALLLIADPPDPRGQPQPGDLPGDFHLWFDGGAARYETTFTDYRFADGTRARVAELLARIQIAFELPDGARVMLEQSPAEPAPTDQLLAAVVEECRRLLESLHAEPALPGTGEPPSVCLIAEGEGPDAPVWRYDPRAGTLAPHSPAAEGERPAGMYFAHARVRYTLASDGRSLSLSYTLGPRYGRGLVFALAERDGRLTLENPRVEWVA